MWLYIVLIKPKLGGNFAHVYVNPKERHGVYFSQVAAFLFTVRRIFWFPHFTVKHVKGDHNKRLSTHEVRMLFSLRITESLFNKNVITKEA